MATWVVFTIDLTSNFVSITTFSLLLKFLSKQNGHRNMKVVTSLYLSTNMAGFITNAIGISNDILDDWDLARQIAFWVFYWLYQLLYLTAQWCFAHMYFVRVNEINYLYLFGHEHARKRQAIYSRVFWFVLGGYYVLLVLIFALWIPTRKTMVSLFAFNLCTISILFDLALLLIAIIRVNTILRVNYPKLKIR